MKKLLVTMLVVAMSIVLLTGCSDNTGDAVTSDVVSEENSETSDVEETDTTDESVNTSEKSSATEEETVVYSADEVMAYIDTLITQFPYNNPEHIKTLVIAANMDYISEEDLYTILSIYGYSIDELAVVYDECILDNAAALQKSLEYSQGQVDGLAEEENYAKRITLESAMLNDYDKEIAEWYDEMLINRSCGNSTSDLYSEFSRNFETVDPDIGSAERTMYTYTDAVYANIILYTDYLNNSYVYYVETYEN